MCFRISEHSFCFPRVTTIIPAFKIPRTGTTVKEKSRITNARACWGVCDATPKARGVMLCGSRSARRQKDSVTVGTVASIL